MPTLMDLVQTVLAALLTGLAASYLIQAWLQGSLFSELHAVLESDWIASTVGRLLRPFPGSGERRRRWAELLNEKGKGLLFCPLCLSFWTSGLLTLMLLATGAGPNAWPLVAMQWVAAAKISVWLYPAAH